MTVAATNPCPGNATGGACRGIVARSRQYLLSCSLVLSCALAPASPAAGQIYRERAPLRTATSDVRMPPLPIERDAAPGAREDVASEGQQLVAESTRRVFELPGLEARVRIRASVSGRQLVASGTYAQMGSGPDKLLRLDLKVPIAGKIGSVQELCGRDYLWIIRNLPPEPLKLERVGLHHARKAVLRGEDAGVLAPLEGWMLLGGLSRMLLNLERHFQFDAPRRDRLGDVPVLLLRGRWKEESLAALVGKEAGGTLPAQLPHEIEIALGDPEGTLPLFPFRIVYLRETNAEGQGRGEGASLEPMVTIEFFQVRATDALDPAMFEYDPEDREFDDATVAYLRRLGLLQPPAK